MDPVLARLFSILKSQTGLDPLPFRDGCSAAEIAAAEQRYGVKLPDGYKAFLQHCDGQSDAFALTFPPDQLVWLSIEEATNLWSDLNANEDSEFFDTFDEDGLTRNVLQHPRRIPIAHNESGGAFLMLDYVPGPNGREGQLVFNINEVDNVVLERDFSSLVASYVRLLEEGKIVVRKQPANFGTGYWFVSSNDELLDWATYKKIRDDK